MLGLSCKANKCSSAGTGGKIEAYLGGSLASGARQLVEQITGELERGEADSPVDAEETLLQLGQEEFHRLVGEQVDDALTGLQSGLTEVLAFVGKSLQKSDSNYMYERFRFVPATYA